jgi:DNA polymerase III alpha subunit
MTKLAIRFGLGAIKAVGFGMMETVVAERKENGDFKDVYDFARRINPRLVNKKSIEALAKSGAFDSIHKNRRQVAESFEILSAYSSRQNEESSSNQMSLFGGMPEANAKPQLKQITDWEKSERLQREFEAFGFYLNEHPIDDLLPELRKRGVVFSDKIERDELGDGMLIKMAGIVATSKHRSSARGRFAYITLSDPFGIFETMIFDEALITSARDILVDGSSIMIECLVRKDDGGIRISIQNVKKLDEFIKNTEAAKEDFEDIKQQSMRNNSRPKNYENRKNTNEQRSTSAPVQPIPQPKKMPSEIEVKITKREQIITVKSLLSKCVKTEFLEGSTAIYLVYEEKRILLPERFLLTEIDLLRIKNLN